MYFEGPEKKFEMVVNTQEVGSLLEKPDCYWKDLVDVSRASIISEISNSECRAYLLSESSLFVFKNRLTMITCGKTTLVKALTNLIKDIGVDQICSLFYERKNEHFPHWQPSSFFDDVKLLKEFVSGKAFQFGKEDHYLYLFHMDRGYEPPQDDMTLEVLMYGLQGRAKEIFESKTHCQSFIGELGVRDIFSGFDVDEHFFDPQGYSMNAIRGKDYFTIHVTPQKLGSYVSFETNLLIEGKVDQVVKKVAQIFKPSSFDVILFHPQYLENMNLPNYYLRSTVKERLSCGYEVLFSHYFEPETHPIRAVELKEIF